MSEIKITNEMLQVGIKIIKNCREEVIDNKKVRDNPVFLVEEAYKAMRELEPPLMPPPPGEIQYYDGKQPPPIQPKQYFLVTAISSEALTNEVNCYIKKGWTPQGGIAWEDGCYAQAMVSP